MYNSMNQVQHEQHCDSLACSKVELLKRDREGRCSLATMLIREGVECCAVGIVCLGLLMNEHQD